MYLNSNLGWSVPGGAMQICLMSQTVAGDNLRSHLNLSNQGGQSYVLLLEESTYSLWSLFTLEVLLQADSHVIAKFQLVVMSSTVPMISLCLLWPLGLKDSPALSTAHFMNWLRWRYTLFPWPPLGWFTKVSDTMPWQDSEVSRL